MLRHQHAGMNLTVLFRNHPWLAATGLLAGLVAIVWGNFGLLRLPTITTRTQPGFNSLMHWRDAGHDWLLVANGQANQLIVYDATDGRPLQRIDVESDLRGAETLAQRDGRLFVVDDDGKLDEVRLPALRRNTSSVP
jgi:hypothetical protein